MKIEIYNKSGSKTSKKIELKDSVFKIEPSDHSVYLAVNSEMAALRQGSHQSKNRSKVSGGGAKPYRQKGTGRARVGSTRNPSRVHGGAGRREKLFGSSSYWCANIPSFASPAT